MNIEKTSKILLSSTSNFSGDQRRTVTAWVIVDGDLDAVTGRPIQRGIDGTVKVGRGKASSFDLKRDAKWWIENRNDEFLCPSCDSWSHPSEMTDSGVCDTCESKGFG